MLLLVKRIKRFLVPIPLTWGGQFAYCGESSILGHLIVMSDRSNSPQAISSGMLKRPPINLNVQSQQATVLLIYEVLKSGIELSEVQYLRLLDYP